MFEIGKIKNYLAENPDIIAAYLFGSAVSGERVVMDVFTKSMACSLLTDKLFERLQPFIVFRNMLVHQYWRVKDEVFLQNMRKGIKDFGEFTVNMKKQF